jgi:ornithine cyclodeaminase/alanine dehydrogenase-like protein (mu-crystallin family)
MALILSRADVQRCLDMPAAIEAMRIAFTALSTGHAQAPQRMAVDLPDTGLALIMPALLQTQKQYAFCLKVVTVIPHNPQRDLPRIFASIQLLDATTGKTIAIMEGGWLTAMRTGAVSGLATSLLARSDANILALFGAGAQAPTQVLAIHTVRPLREVRVVNRNDAHYHNLVQHLQTLLGPSCPPIVRASSSKDALAGATLVACATASSTPLFTWSEIAPGTHINAIGAFTPTMREVDSSTLAHALIVVDQREAALTEAGDLIQPLASGLISGPEAWLELGELVTGKHPARQTPGQVTFFKSVGLAVQDTAVATHVYNQAIALGIGREIDL